MFKEKKTPLKIHQPKSFILSSEKKIQKEILVIIYFFPVTNEDSCSLFWLAASQKVSRKRGHTDHQNGTTSTERPLKKEPNLASIHHLPTAAVQENVPKKRVKLSEKEKGEKGKYLLFLSLHFLIFFLFHLPFPFSVVFNALFTTNCPRLHLASKVGNHVFIKIS